MAPRRLLRGHFTVAAYHRLAETGALEPDARVELLDGQVVDMSPIGSRHAGTVKWLSRRLASLLGDRAILGVQDPVVLDDYSEPEPDIAVLRPRPDFYRGAHPRPSDVLLMVEVADATVDTDRDIKIPLYARAGLREVWLVNLNEDRIEVYWDPRGGEYASVTTRTRTDAVTMLAFADVAVSVDEIVR
jgi:Uma2 family endonuclease